jgi:predicted metal-dependent hydrolase
MSESPDYDPRYLRGIEFFNECEFFEAHEVWEELWSDVQGPSRRFYQGLIQVAVCLHHFGNGNLRGAQKLYHSSRGYLTQYEPLHLGLDVSQLLDQLGACCASILANDEPTLQVEIDPELIPEIHLSPPA